VIDDCSDSEESREGDISDNDGTKTTKLKDKIDFNLNNKSL
jgi:hypothetical protein